MTRTSAFTLILNQGHRYVNAFLFIQILNFNARRGLSNNQEERISLFSITIWESWMAGGGKLKREKIILDMNFHLWEHETLELYEGLWGSRLHIALLNFNYQIDHTMLFPMKKSLGGKVGITCFLYLDFCSVPFQ